MLNLYEIAGNEWPMYAKRLTDITPFRVMELMERAKLLEADGKHVVHFEVGEPDFATAGPIVTAGERALAAGETKYTQALGIPQLRERIARFYADEVGVSVPAERIGVTSGASGGRLRLCGLMLDPGDELLMSDPGYPCNEVFVGLVNAIPRRVPVTAQSHYQIQLEDLVENWTARTRGVLLASPANPTGAVIGRDHLSRLTAEAHGRGGFVLLDEIYQGLIYADSPEYRSGLEVDQDIFILNSFSKYFGMTGWRLGWLVVAESALSGITRLAQNLFISPSSIAQHAALAAFEPAAMEIHEARRQKFAARRNMLAQGMASLGFTVPHLPDGAFYLYVDISRTGMKAEEFCWRLIDEYQVAVTPGSDFGTFNADQFVRFAYTTADEDIHLGVERLGKALVDWGIGCG
ncbi:MAG: aminotransferase class I/II-fold pyridoxal phosphate-dependent enzyme [Pseudomonadales bacterium]